jgi:hypothetical protein
MMTKNSNTSSTTSTSNMSEIQQGIKLIRLQSGEDIIAGLTEDSESNMVMLDNPMHLIFKRTSQGTVMFMLPWLPIELIKDNIATIVTDDILTIVEPKDDLIEYYGNIINQTHMRAIKDDTMANNIKQAMEDDLDDISEEEENEERLTKEEILDLINRKRTKRLH